ncbi:hypothetical protein C2U70_16160 [Bradyrhizobium guangdongense]|uniref:hypothetical protein n=1 Tax=Bradyrhizobium guangdongense TaxID=1325090 RepID=UPI0011290DED|nr:hypothetical protein [Bradyrhizobium guangdongense]TPQ34879.1 hypothetical protein C2U70_16160 [Bradyrhizobium guangdongense]
MQPLFQSKTSTMQLQALIADLRWKVQLLDSDIQDEEQRARVSDPTALAYPMLAITLRGRRENLLVTIAALEDRLKAVDSATEWTRAA